MKIRNIFVLLFVVAFVGCASISRQEPDDFESKCIDMCTSELKQCNENRGVRSLDNKSSALLLVGTMALGFRDRCRHLYKKEKQCLRSCMANIKTKK